MNDLSPFGTTAEYDPSCTYALAPRSTPRLVRPTIADARSLVIRRALAHPFRVLNALRSGQAAQDVAGALLLQDTTHALGLTTITGTTGEQHPLGPLMLAGGRSAAAARPRPRVGGLIIAQNEEACLGRALTSLRPLVDEIVVVDGGSTDRTMDIAREHGARVVERTFDRDFAAQRNAGLDALRSDWALTLDADEYISDELAAALGWLLDHELDVEAVCMPLLNLVGTDPQPTAWPDVQPRLFLSRLRFEGVVHERIRFSRGIMLSPDGPFVHHHKDPLRHYSNALRYSEIDASPYTEQELAWLKEETARLQREAEDGPS